jgi:predicted permease
MSPFFAEIIAATRSLRRAPGFTALALAMLALGIGANVAVFSIFQSIILRPLPYPEPERLVGLTAANASKALTMPALSASDYRDIRERAGSFKSVAAYRPDFVSYAPQAGDPVQLVAANVTEDFFATFGTGPVRGRTFEAAEFSIEATRTAVLSHSAWRRHFGGRENVVGAVITLNDVPTTIVGIMPGDFREPELVEVWVPFPAEAPEYFARDSRFWTTIGRLAPGVGVAGARAEVAMIAAALAREHPATNSGWTASVRPLLELRVGGLRTSLALLVGAVGLVLLIACVNLANLMLARGVGRMQELAVRLALGATPRSLARGIFLESVLLAVIGGAAGAVIAALGLPQLTRLLPPGLVPRSHAIEVDGTALLFAIAVSAITGIVFGLLPAWQVTRTNVGEALKSGGSRGGTSRFVSRTQAALIVGQLAITLVVLAAAAVLMRSLLALQRTNPGFDPRGVLTVRLAPPPSKWETFQ